MKAGILYPRSAAHPGMMLDFMDGIKAVLKQQPLKDRIELVAETIGLGGNEKEVYDKMEKLLVLEGVDVLVAYIDLRVLDTIKQLLLTSGKLTLIVNPGANYPQDWTPQPNIIHLTLQHAFLCWLTGKLAVQKDGLNAVMATSFYDCGYLHTAAIAKSFADSGGNINFNYINNQRYDDSFDIAQLTHFLNANKETRSLLCVMDSFPGRLLYAGLNNYKDAARLQLFVSPMMLESKAVENTDNGYAFPVEGYIPWHAAAENSANHDFSNDFPQQTGRLVNIFSLLGWETGLILQQTFLQGGGQYNKGAELAGRLSVTKINSPRGELKLDPPTNYFIAPVYRCAISQNTTEPIIEYIETPAKEWRDFVAEPAVGASSGWLNTYLCY